MRRLLLPALLSVALLLLLIAPDALAQNRTGRIVGTIYDDEGMPMAGAQVTISSPTQIGGARTATTEQDGAFKFLNLIPGVFEVKVRKPGFQGQIKKGVRVHVAKTVTLDILLDRSPGAPPPPPPPPTTQPGKPGVPPPPRPPPRAEPEPRSETYVITAARPVVDVTKATTGETLSDEFMENVPLLSRSYQSVAQMTPGVSGGSNPNVLGGSYFNNTYTVDGMDTSDPVTHTFSTNFNFDAMSDVNVMTGALGPEYSDTPGGVVNMVTRSGSNQFELDSSIYYQNDALTIKTLDEKDRTFNKLDFNLNVGGPIIRDKLWYFTSFEINHDVQTLPSDINQVLPDHPSRIYLGFKWLGKLTWQLNPKHKLIFWGQTSPATISNTLQNISIEPEAERHQDQYNALTSVSWEWLATENTFVKTQLGFSWNGLRIRPETGDRDTSQVSDIGSGVVSRNDTRFLEDDRYKITLNADATQFWNDKFGDHEVKGGLRFQHMINPSSELYTGNAIYQSYFGKPNRVTRYYLPSGGVKPCDPAKGECETGTLDTTVSGSKLIVFLKDTWKVPGTKKRLRLIPGGAFHFGNTINPEGQTVSSFVAGTPHLNFAWDIFGDGTTALRGGYNQYVDVGFLALARFIGRDFVTYRCLFDESTQDYTSNCTVGGQTRTVGRPQGPDYDADGNAIDKFNPGALTVPRVHELSVGAEREWLTGFSTGVDFQWRQFTHQWEDLETNVIWNESGTDTTGFKNGQSEFIYDLETPEEAERRYLGLSLFARKFIGDWQVMASYTWSKTEGTVAGGYATVFLDRPRQVPFFFGDLPNDRRHVVKLNGFYRWRKILTFSLQLNFGTGEPYDKLFFNNYFGDYNDRRAVRGHDPRDLSTPDDDEPLRLPPRLNVGLKVVWNMRHLTKALIGERHNIELIGEIFNLFNLRAATAVEQRNLLPGATTQWGDIIDTQDPFRVRFGVRYRY
jgi:hypothetical protein